MRQLLSAREKKNYKHSLSWRIYESKKRKSKLKKNDNDDDDDVDVDEDNNDLKKCLHLEQINANRASVTGIPYMMERPFVVKIAQNAQYTVE